MTDEPRDDLVEVRRCRHRGEAREHGLVLAAVGIESYLLEPRGDGTIGSGKGGVAGPDNTVALCVRVHDAARARQHLAAYAQENAAAPRPARRPVRERLYGVETALAYVAVLVFLFSAQTRGAFGVDWVGAGVARAGLIVDGAWWRALTALGLHVDLGHLLSNLAFGAVFGVLAARLLGAGVAWLAIVLAGGLGNALNAALQAPDHSAVGASTAVFGALGLLSGFTQRSHVDPWRRGLRRWAPVAAGLMLLAFLGIGGPGVDVGAHIAGFLVGGGLGVVLARSGVQRRLDRPTVQRGSGIAAGVLFAAAWWMAFAG